MSVDQLAILDGWKRPEDALPPPIWFENSASATPMAPPNQDARVAQFVDLVQDAAADCSIVASMSAGIARAERGFPDVSIFLHAFKPKSSQVYPGSLCLSRVVHC